ncbi:VOC family protein [Paenibacillus harenae]|uniref:VOC family protein n=1 Tax=Paenibacillus harenae TaxID=306543 RepID=UPI00278D5D47|nr:VOC family protein [Paenibacillus harenae]MDQ0060227.1 PhnB protein [Paenibacillus harenae]
MLKAIPFIMLDGKAAEAIRFYEEALGATVVFKQTFGESPGGENFSSEEQERLAHSVLRIGDTQLFTADIGSDFPYKEGNQVNICLTTADVNQSRQFFQALQQGGQVNIPLGEVHFSPAYGVVTDHFGVTFQIFTVKPHN